MTKSFKYSPLIIIITGLVFLSITPTRDNLLSVESLHGLKLLLMYITGVIAMIGMTFSIILSTKFKFLTKTFGGKGNISKLHKFTGITSFIFIVLHFLTIMTSKIVIALNLSPKVDDGPTFLDKQAALLYDFYNVSSLFSIDLNTYTSFLVNLFNFSIMLALPTFFMFVVSIIISINKKFSYKTFMKVHKIMPFLYLSMAFHGIMILTRGNWFTSISGIAYLIFLGFGIYASFYKIFKMLKTKKTLDGANSKKILNATEM